jgi:hypothetical protein
MDAIVLFLIGYGVFSEYAIGSVKHLNDWNRRPR